MSPNNKKYNFDNFMNGKWYIDNQKYFKVLVQSTMNFIHLPDIILRVLELISKSSTKDRLPD